MLNSINLLSAFNWYGFLIASGMIICFIIAYFLAADRGYYKDLIFDIAVICVPLAIIGARLYYVIFDALAGNSWTFLEILGVGTGGLRGLSILGGLLGGISGAVIIHFWKRKKADKDKINFLQIADLGFCLIPLGQAIGRWGNFFNKEAYGPLVDWHFFPLTVDINGSYHLATFFYESMLDLAIACFLIWCYRGKKKSFDGFIFSSYCILYGTGRAIIETLRQDALMAGTIRVSQLTAVLFIIFGVSYIIYYLFKADKSGLKKFIMVDKAKLDDSYYGYKKSRLSDPNIYLKKGGPAPIDPDEVEDFYSTGEFYEGGSSANGPDDGSQKDEDAFL